MSLDKVTEYLPEWISDQNKLAHTKGLVFGMSGGIDSSVIAALCKKSIVESLGLIMPCFSNPQDEIDALLVSHILGVKTTKIDFEATFRQIVANMYPLPLDKLALGNIKARLRMTILYSFANSLNYLVVGSDDYSENYVGYFTKYGDGACDIAPLANLTKTEVRELGRLLGVPYKIIIKPSSPGLWSEQTAEEEMGISYKDIDTYLRGNQLSLAGCITEKIAHKHFSTEHKRNMPIIPPIF